MTTFEALRARWKQEREAAATRAAATRRKLMREGRAIFEQFHLKKVILFGSVLENSMHAGSDLDLLVDDLAPEVFFDFQCRLEEVLDISVDVHTMRDDPAFVAKIQRRGEVIYEI